MATPLLQLRQLTKTFGPKVANDRIDLDIQPGKIHAIVGENGAGKTTLMSMINGTAVPDSGEIIFEGRPVTITSPQQAQALGVGMVFQHFKLVGSLTVAANVFLGRELTKGFTLDAKAMEARVAELSSKFGLDVNPTAITNTLSVGELQRVEVLKALSHDTRLLILDEPTAVLTPGETDDLFVVIRDLAAQGVAVVFISHKLDEVLAIADEITVIRDGRTIATRPAAGLSKEDIATMMVGRDVLLRIKHTPATPGEEVLAVRDLSVVDERGVTNLDRLSLSVRSGEIVGIAGVEGNGQAELTAIIAGMLKPTGGKVFFSGRDVTGESVKARRDAGMAYIPEDRHHVGTGPKLTVAENMAATHLVPPVAKAGWISNGQMANLGAQLIRKFDVRGAAPSTPVGSLSGGNMQKVVIAREFESNPRILVVSQPTRGVDVGAMEFVHNAIVAMRDAGAGVLLVSADLNEVMSLSDRLLVMHRGGIIAEFTQETMNETAVGLAMAGVDPDEDQVAQAEAAHQGVVATLTAAAPVAEVDPDDVRSIVEAAKVSDEGPVEVDVASTVNLSTTDRPATRTRTREVIDSIFTSGIQPILAILAALVVGFVIIAAIGKDPFLAYGELFFSAFTSPPGMGSLIAQVIPLLILSSAVIISFRAGFFNIGGEGQLFMGAFGGAIVGLAVMPYTPGWLTAIIAILAGMVFGAVWGFIPGALYAFWKVNIIVTTLMMSTIATLLTAYFISGPFKDPNVGSLASRRLDADVRLPIFAPQYNFGLDIFIAIAVVIIMGFILTRSVWGLRVRELGELNRFAEYTGVSPKAMSIQVMSLAGAVSGLAGALFVLGPNSGGRFLHQFSPGYGFLAITVALLARLNPWAAFAAAAFYANMMAGSNSMQINAGVPYPMVQILQGLIIIFITATFVFNWRRKKKNEATRGGTEPALAGAAATESSFVESPKAESAVTNEENAK